MANWVVNTQVHQKGDKCYDVEIAIVWSDFEHGFKSYGWEGNEKRIIFEVENEEDYCLEKDFKVMKSLAEKTCELYNSMGVTPENFTSYEDEDEYDEDEYEDDDE